MPSATPTPAAGSRRKPAPQFLQFHVMHFAEVGR